MGEIRFTPEARNLIPELADKRLSFEEAIPLMVQLLEVTMKEEEVPCKFSEDTGEPVEFKWVPYVKWDGVIYTHKEFSGEVHIKSPFLQDSFLSLNEREPLGIKVGGNYYSLSTYYLQCAGREVKAGVCIKPMRMREFSR